MEVRPHAIWRVPFGPLVVSVLILAGAVRPAAAQDQGLDPLVFVPGLPSQFRQAALDARSLQLYRLPLSFHLRRVDRSGWGLRITFPVTLSSIRVQTIADSPRFVKALGIAAVIPGVEFELPLGDHLRLKPFGEVGVGKGTEGGKAEALYGGGVRARLDASAGRLHWMLGGSAMRRKPSAGATRYGAYSTFEGAIAAQMPLGFSVGTRAARGGVYAIVRGFDDLVLKEAGRESMVLRRQFEIGGSFSTAPELRVWKIRLPWIAVGYQFSRVISGVRLYVTFPF